LIEIVSEPDMRSAQEAGAYLRTLKQILEFIDVSDVNMEEGSLRVDANISARLRGETRLGTKTEVKNMNSFSGVERALDAEFARQVQVLERGGRIEQQTMLWDGARGIVRPARSKEASHDYRYFPEPDLPPLVLSKEWIDERRRSLPELPVARRTRFAKEYALPPREVEILTSSTALSDYFEQTARAHGDPKAVANWVLGEVLAAINAAGLSLREFRVRPADLGELLNLVGDGKVSHTAAKRIFSEMIRSGERAIQIAEREGLLQEGSADAITVWVDEVMAEYPEEARRFLAGERKLLGVLVGAVMKKSKGRADPRRVNQLLSSRTTG
jgi:aspartyl-tRNA(Asn)/glutamyl-tRNA(Gln) amidotransferase subunit B